MREGSEGAAERGPARYSVLLLCYILSAAMYSEILGMLQQESFKDHKSYLDLWGVS